MRETTRSGLVMGLVMATLYSAYALVVFLLQGSNPFAKNQTTIQAVLVTYYAAGALGGSVVGALSPLARSWPGRILVGVLAACVVEFCLATAVEGPFWLWQSNVWKGLAFLSVFFGVVCSYTWRKFVGS